MRYYYRIKSKDKLCSTEAMHDDAKVVEWFKKNYGGDLLEVYDGSMKRLF